MMADHADVPAPTTRPRWTTVTALVASIGVAGVLLAACGGGSAKSSSASSPSPSSSAAGSSAAGSSTANATTTQSTATSGSSASSSTVIPHGNSASSFCGFARAVSAQQNKNVAVFTSGDPAAIEKLEKQNLSVLNAAVSAAPASIRPSMVILATTNQALYKQLQAVKFDFRKLGTTDLAKLNSPALTKASDNVTSYLTNVCHISTDAPTTR